MSAPTPSDSAIERNKSSERGLLFAIVSATIIAYLPLFNLPWIIAILVTERGHDDIEAGVVGTIMALSLAISTIVFGAFISRLPRRAVAITAVTTISVALLILSLRPQPTIFLGSIVVFAVGAGACGAIGSSLISSAKNPTRMAGALWAFLALSQATIWTITPRSVSAFGEVGLFTSMLAYAFVAAPFMMFANLTKTSTNNSKTQSDPGVRRVNASSVLIVATLFLVIVFWLRDGVTWSLTERRSVILGIEPHVLSSTLLATSFFGFLGAILATQFDRLFSQWVNLFFGLLVVGMVMVVIAGATTELTYLSSFVFWSGTSIFAWTFILGLSAKLDQSGRVVAIANGVSFAAGAFGPILGGFLIQYSGGAYLLPAIVTLTVATVVCGGMMFQSRREENLRNANAESEN